MFNMSAVHLLKSRFNLTHLHSTDLNRSLRGDKKEKDDIASLLAVPGLDAK